MIYLKEPIRGNESDALKTNDVSWQQQDTPIPSGSTAGLSICFAVTTAS